MLAFPNVTGDCFALDGKVLVQGFEKSRDSPRKRIILPLHRTQDAPVQRMLNFFQPGTYVQPHVHPREGQIETVYVLRGRVGFVIFEPNGKVRQVHELLGDGTGMIDIENGVWHGMVCLAPNSVILEVKMGPYDPETDKSFADWAPPEEAAEGERYLQSLKQLFA
ncbi:MAG: WbuC family cupin fold metalloprotein [Verrucomicrobiota bacterium]